MQFTTIISLALALSSANALVIPSLDTAGGANVTLSARSEPIEAPIRIAAKNLAVPHKYIVVLKNDVSAENVKVHKTWVSKTQTDFGTKLASSEPKSNFFATTKAAGTGANGGISFEFDIASSLKGYSGYFLEDTIKEIQKHPEVAFIEQDAIVHAYGPSNGTAQGGAPWGLARISTKESLNGAATGKYLHNPEGGAGVTSYIVDTGVNTAHKEFEGRATWGTTFPTDGDTDGVGHGTHCAGTIGSKTYGVAKKATLVAVKVLDASGSGTNTDVIKGIQWVAAKHKENASKSGYKGSTANMSLGGGKSQAVDDAANAAVDAGVHFAVAAGNENDDACNSSPAAAEKVVTVGASTNKDARAEFSNFGKCVDIFAPGLDILSTWIGSTSATNTISGTSMASPHIAGLLTYFLSLAPSSGSEYTSASAITPEQLKKAIIAFGTADALSDVGTDSPNVLAFNGAGGSLADLWATK